MGCGAGTAEKMAGKITRDPGKQARGEERKVIRSERSYYDVPAPQTDALLPGGLVLRVS